MPLLSLFYSTERCVAKGGFYIFPSLRSPAFLRSPLVCREAALFAAGDTDARIENMAIPAVAEKLEIFFAEHLNHPKPYYYAQADGTVKQFAFCPIRQYGDCREAASFTELMDNFYIVRDRKDAMRQKSQAVRSFSSPVMTARVKFWGPAARMAMAALGPTPLTEVSSS